MNISVIFATYKRPQILSQTLSSLVELRTEGLKWEVLVVDNAGDTANKRIVESFIDRLPLQFFVEKTPGKNNALNHAIKRARGDLFIFTDDDIIAQSDWLIEMWEGAKRWPKFSMFGGRILPKFPLGKIPISIDDPFFKDAFVIADWDMKEGPFKAKNIWGPNMAVRAEIFHSGWSFNPNIGPNGKNYIMGSETEFTTRLEKAGFKSVYLPNSMVYHQIRPEQLRVKWLYGRAFRAGRRRALENFLPDLPMLFGVPRSLLRTLISLGLKRLLFFFKRETAIQLGIKYWRTKGLVCQYREDLLIKGK